MEKLAALYCLWLCELCTNEDYSAELDRLFLENPEDDLLLALECPAEADGKRIDDDKLLRKLDKRATNRALFVTELFTALGDFYDKHCVSDEEFDESGKITLWQFSERCFELSSSLNVEWELNRALQYPHFTYENLDRHAGEFPLSDEEYIEEIKRNFRALFDKFKEKK